MFRRLAALLLTWSIVTATPLFSRADDDTSALINQALDKQIQLTLNNLLPQAMTLIEQKTGVSMKADAAVWDLLPWGRDTNINATIANQTLREALDAITRKLGLQYQVREGAVILEPIPALRRLARRSTVQELGCLDTLSTIALDQPGQLTVKQLLDAVDAKLAAAKGGYAVDRPNGEIVRMDAPVNIARNSTLIDAVEAMTKQTNATWYPWGKTVVVLAKSDEIKRQINRTITVRFNGVDVQQVLMELSQKAGVPFNLEAGAIQTVPPEARNIRLVLDDYSIQDALESICGVTGLDYMVRDTGIYVWNQAANPSQRTDRVVMMMPVRGTDITILITESQVPADLREYVKMKQQKQFDGIREQMKEEGFHPATQPARTTPPAPPAPIAPATKATPKPPGEDL